MPAASVPVLPALAFVVGCVAIRALRRHADLMHELLVASLIGLLVALVIVAISIEEAREIPLTLWNGSME